MLQLKSKARILMRLTDQQTWKVSFDVDSYRVIFQKEENYRAANGMTIFFARPTLQLMFQSVRRKAVEISEN